MSTEVLPEADAEIAINAYRAAGARVTGVLGNGAGSRYAKFVIEMPSGQEFEIQVEEIM